jgi:CspA family cold shock protein
MGCAFRPLNTFFINVHRLLTRTTNISATLPSCYTKTAEGRRVLAVSQRTGIVESWFNGEGGYGFIHPDDGGEAVFAHHTSIVAYAKAKSLKKGARVSYEVARRKMGGLWAKDVCTTD